jgi:bla regulator protein blaR1
MRNHLLAAVSFGAVLAVGLPSTPRVHAQTPTPAPDAAATSFEVASVKANKGGSNGTGIGFQPGGRFRATNAPLKMLIGIAYASPQPLPVFQIAGGDKWIESERFDIVAKAAIDFKPGPNGPPPEMFLMLQSLLAERFHLLVHRESKEQAVFALVLARSDGTLGPQLHQSATDCAALLAAMRARGGPPAPPPPGERPPCGMRMFPGNLSGGSATMAQLTNVLARFVNRTVIDRTGLAGGFDVDLQWTPDQMPQGRGDPPPGAPALPPIDPNGPSLFTAVQEQLGLKLESTKAPVDILVIDHVERPTED